MRPAKGRGKSLAFDILACQPIPEKAESPVSSHRLPGRGLGPFAATPASAGLFVNHYVPILFRCQRQRITAETLNSVSVKISIGNNILKTLSEPNLEKSKACLRGCNG